MKTQVFLTAMAVIVLTACAPLVPVAQPTPSSGGGGALHPVTPAVSGPLTPAPRAPTLAIAADLVLRDEHNGRTFTLKQGQTVGIVLSTGERWKMTYDANLLQLLPHTESSQPNVWVLRATRRGTTVIALKTESPPCPSGQNCPGAPVEIFEVTLVIND